MRRKCDDPQRHTPAESLAEWRSALLTRRTFLLRMAGGSVAALFAPLARAGDSDRKPPDDTDTWKLLDAVQQHLFPSEPGIPGAKEIRALDYLRFVVDDPRVDADERVFIIKGVGWLDGMARERTQRSFLVLNQDEREQVLRHIARSSAGENWLSTLLLYTMEALLSDPAYGGNPDGIGWRWLQHTPGFPRPPADKIYPRLLS